MVLGIDFLEGTCCKREYDVSVGICKRGIWCWGLSYQRKHALEGNMMSVWEYAKGKYVVGD